jgi:S1-C subfamily serine protease
MGWIAAFGGIFLYLTALLAYGPTPDPLNASVIIEDLSGHGSGVFISPTQILTAKHVAAHVKGGLRVRGPEGDIYHVIGVANGPADIAVLTVDRPLRGLPLGTSCRPLKRGDELYYYGSPLNMEFIGPIEISYMGGRAARDIDDPSFDIMADSGLLANGEAEPGVSGAGVIDSSGKVVGVYNFAWNGTTYGGFVSLSYPAVCEFVLRELQPGANA